MTAKDDDVELQTNTDFALAQSKGTFCGQMIRLVGTPNVYFTFDNKSPREASLT